MRGLLRLPVALCFALLLPLALCCGATASPVAGEVMGSFAGEGEILR
ncbi:hypothetical protein [Enterobacter hormaechei]|nr:hypothetical protein [Enterobacter hormaechei]